MIRKSKTVQKIALIAWESLFFLAFCLFLPISSFAQFSGYNSPQSIDAVLAQSGTACTGTPQTFSTASGIPNFRNLGQTQHYAYIKTTSVTNLVMQIYGLDNNNNPTLISDTATSGAPSVGPIPILKGSGAFANIEVSVTCFPISTGTFFLSYAGTSATNNENVGSYLLTQIDKSISSAAPANANYTAVVQPPFGTSLGALYFQYTGTGPAGSTLNVLCQTTNGTGPGSFSFSPAVTSAVEQTFAVPAEPCPNATVEYVSGGASSATYLLDYVFIPAGSTVSNSYAHVASTTATAIKAGPGVLHSVVVGTPATGTITFSDLASGSCTGTPSSNTVSVITAASTFPAGPEIYDALFTNGICVKASATMDITVSYQ